MCCARRGGPKTLLKQLTQTLIFAQRCLILRSQQNRNELVSIPETNQSLGSANKAPGVHTPSADEDAAGVPADESATAAAAANVVKVGAFVSRPLSAAERLSMAEDDEDDPLLQLCSVDTTPSKPAPSAAQEAAPQHSETDSSDPVASKMDNLRLDESAGITQILTFGAKFFSF